MYRQTTQLHSWLSQSELTSFIAFSLIVPGPNVMVVALIGWKAAGVLGALAATLGMCVPCAILTIITIRGWERLKSEPWRSEVLMALNSVTVGLIAASAFVMTKSVDQNSVLLGVSLVTDVVLYFTKLNPLWLIGTGGVIGLIAGQ